MTSHTLLVGSRKGLFVVRGQGSSWHIAAHHFAGEPVTQVLQDPRDGAWYCALRMGHFGVKMRKSPDPSPPWVPYSRRQSCASSVATPAPSFARSSRARSSSAP